MSATREGAAPTAPSTKAGARRRLAAAPVGVAEIEPQAAATDGTVSEDQQRFFARVETFSFD